MAQQLIGRQFYNIQRKVLLCFCVILVTGCASTGNQGTGEADMVNPDPWEGLNRAVFAFNDTLDTWFLKPVAKGYRFVTPDIIERGIANIFDNLEEVPNALNNILQWKWKQAGNDSGRFLVNSTVGLLGIFDVAAKIGLEKSDGEDFGQTLGKWGLADGPYLVLPFLGPATLRDSAGLPVDWYTSPIPYVEPQRLENSLKVGRVIDTRAGLLQAEKLISGDKYSFIRDVYLQRREFLINDGQVEDDFGDDFGEDDEYGE